VGSVPRRAAAARLARASVGAAGTGADIVPQKKKNVRHSIGSSSLQGSVGEKIVDDISLRQQSFGESIGIFPLRKSRQGLTLVHFSAQLKRIMWDRDAFRGCVGGV
jgi:hypothetical protein